MNAIFLPLRECGVGLRVLTNSTQFHSGFFPFPRKSLLLNPPRPADSLPDFG
jgi:hypothetical protein